MREPDFNNIISVLNKKVPSRPTLFEFYINNKTSERLSGRRTRSDWDCPFNYEVNIKAMSKAGYDYITLHGSEFGFTKIDKRKGYSITDRESFENYQFMDPKKSNYLRLIEAEKLMPKKMKIIVFGSGGILENVTELVGYENLCMLLYDNRKLVEDIFEAVGSSFLEYYKQCLKYDSVGVIMTNDDWGFNTGTMFAPEDMRQLVFPYHKKIVELAHQNNRQAILHSCGNLSEVMDDIIDDMKYDGKHSFEDSILPVEKAYEKYQGRIAILGGIDLDFMTRKTPQEITSRCENLLKLTNCKGYALGTGNSIADYIPFENFSAMIKSVNSDFDL